MTSSLPSALTITATVPGVVFAVGISTLTGSLLPVFTVTAGAVPVFLVAFTAGVDRVTASPPLWAALAAAPGRVTSASTLPEASVLTMAVAPSFRATVVTVEPSDFSTVWVLLPAWPVSVVVTVPSFLVSTTIWELLRFLVVSVTVPVTLAAPRASPLPPPPKPCPAAGSPPCTGTAAGIKIVFL